MRFLVIILIAAIMAFSGCDLDLGDGSDQYQVTFDVDEGEQGVVYKKGENSYGNLPIYQYHTSKTSGVLIASKSGVDLTVDGTVDVSGGAVDTAGDYFYLKVNGNIIESSGSKIRYKGNDYDGLKAEGTVTIENPDSGEINVRGSSFEIVLDGTGTDITIKGKFTVLGMDMDAGDDPDK